MTIWKPLNLALAVTSLASTAVAHEPGVQGMDTEIGMCVTEVGKRADYGDARRVVHRVIDVDQKNLAEQRISIDTLVYTAEGETVAREYASRCVTRGALKVVSFKIQEKERQSYSAAL